MPKTKARKDNKGRSLWKGETYRESDGKYQFAYYDSYGKRRYIYSKDIIKLREREQEILRDRMDGISSEVAKNQTLNMMFDKYMDSRKGELENRTFAGYMYQYDAYVRNTIGQKKIASIKYSDILLFYKGLMKDKGLSYGTIEHMQREINPAFEMAVRDNLIRVNPCSQVLGQVKKQTGAERGKRYALSPEHQNSFLEFMSGHPVYNHWKPIFTFLLGTGLRAGEMSGLTWDDINIEEAILKVDHALVYFAGKRNKTKKKLYMKEPKTEAGKRTVPLVKEVIVALDEIKKYQIENGIECTSSIDGYENFVFLNRFGNVFIEYNLDRALKRIIKSYNDEELFAAKKEKRKPDLLPHFTCHCLRHTFCTRLCENDTNIKVIQSIMGHKDIQTTMNIYAEVTEKKKQTAMNEIANKLNLF